jgi:dTDP-4-amino-4,6-dideoxygalactose transaminase
MDPYQLKMALSDKTAAVMPVHLTGKVCQMDSISKICDDAGIPVIEDAAQCIGAMHNGKYGGAFGVAGCFSAHPLKNLNAFGDSGFVVTDDDNVATSIRLMRNHGLLDRNTVERFGYVSRMDALQAAVLKWKLENQLESVNQRRRKNADFYSQRLTDDLVKPFEDKADLCVYHTYVIQTESRDELQAHLARHGIGSAIHYPVPIHKQPAYIRKFGEYTKFDLGVTEAQASRILSLPIHQNLGEQELSHVVATVNDFFGVR